MLVESLDGWRFDHLSRLGGPQLAILGIIASGARWVIKTLSVTVLIGAVVGVIDLQARRELTVIKATGMSIWRVLRAPTIAVLLAGLAVSLVAEGITTKINRDLSPSQPGGNRGITPSGDLWLEQGVAGQRYVVTARHVLAGGTELDDVVIFLTDGDLTGRIVSPVARLADGAWHLGKATRYRTDLPPEHLADFTLPTSTTPGDLRLKLSSTEDMTIFELAAALSTKLSDPEVESAVATRFMRLVTLPVLLVGSLFIAFAFTAGYRRSNGYGAAVLYGIVLGFVVFVITEMADRAGSAGVLDPTLAAVGPAFVAIVIGLTVLLRKEDGRA